MHRCSSDGFEIISIINFNKQVIHPTGHLCYSIAAFGFAAGTYKGLKTANNENYRRLPAAWKAIIEDGKIKLWQVYADTKVVFELMGKNG